MFYVSSCKGNLIGVTDTKDDVEEFYTKEQLETFNVDIIRFNKELPLGYKFETKCFNFELIEIDGTKGWNLKYKEGNTIFQNKSNYLGYPVISLENCFKYYEPSTIDISGMDTSNVINMRCMFFYCHSLTTLDLSNFNTSRVTNMSGMFIRCESLTTLDLDSFNTSNVMNMNNMFNDCKSLITLYLSNFDTINVTDMYHMFSKCHSITTLDLGNFNTSNVTDTGGMFSECHYLTTLDLSSFNTSNVTNMAHMFEKCHSLTILDLSSFDTSNVTNILSMFGMFSNSNIRLVKCNNYNIIEQVPNIGLIEASKCKTYDKRIRVKRGTKLKDIASKLCLLIDKGIVAYEEVD